MWIAKEMRVVAVWMTAALIVSWVMLAYRAGAADPEIAPPQASTPRGSGTSSKESKPVAPRSPDYSTPQKTLLAFCEAMRAGNLDAAKDCSIRPNAKTKRLRDATARYAVAQHCFQKAASAKFGKDRLWNDNVAIWAAGVKDAKILARGDRVLLQVKQDGTTFKFKKEGATWKLDLIDFSDDAIDKVKPAALDRMARDLDEDARTYQSLLKRIESGRLKTAEDVKRVLGEEFHPRAYFDPDDIIP